MNKANEPLKIEVADGRLVISIGVSTLAYALPLAPGLQCEEGSLLTVKDDEQFARDIARELEHEDEGGDTPVHCLLEKAAWKAVEWSEAAEMEEPGDE